jgi:hypothetical protein
MAAISMGRPHGADNPQVMQGLRRLTVAASALTATGAVPTATADAIVEGQQLALALRRRLGGWPFGMGRVGRMGWSGPHLQQSGGEPARPLTATSIGRHVPLALDDRSAEVNLLALVVDAERAVLTLTAKPPPDLDDDQPADLPADEPDDNNDDDYEPTEFLFDATATDDRHTDYDVACYTNDSDHDDQDDELWTSRLELTPAPPADRRWLDLTLWPGTPPVRIALNPPQSPPEAMTVAAARTEARTVAMTAEPLPDGGRVERCVDIVASHLLASRRWARPDGSVGLDDLSVIVDALIGAGVLAPDSQALHQLATLGRRLRFKLPASLHDRTDAELPPAWRSVLDNADAADGPAGVLAAAAVLPDIDGTSWALAGLRSTATSMQLRMFGWNFTSADRPQQLMHHGAVWLREAFSIWARDDAGRWHVAGRSESSWDANQADLALELTPPLHPMATSLDVILTTSSERVTVTLPLDWLTPAQQEAP